MQNKYKFLKVTINQLYMVPMLDDEVTKINGWTIGQVKNDWFIQHPISQRHATRDAYMLGYSERVVHIEEHADFPEEYKNEVNRKS